MNPFRINIYIGNSRNKRTRFYSVQVFEGNTCVKELEVPTWSEAKFKARGYCLFYGLGVFSTERVSEHYL